MTINIGVLGQVLFNPRKAFESIKEQTSMGDGILMYIILNVIGGIIGMVVTYAAWGGIVTQRGVALGMGNWAVSLIVGLIIGVIVLITVALLASKIAASIGKGKDSLDKTVGFLGYAEVVNLVMGILMAVVMVAIMGNAYSTALSGSVQGTAGAAIGSLAIIGILGVLAFIWMLYVGGSAVAVANDVSLGAGIVSYFIAALIVGLIVSVIVVAGLMTMGLSMLNSGYFPGVA